MGAGDAVAWLAAALALSACGYKRPADVPGDGGDVVDASGGGIAECTAASGTQVKVVVRQHTDDSQQFVRLIDSRTGRECRFVPAADGKVRCMPFSDMYSDGFVAYSNDTCTTPILGIFTNRFYNGELFVGYDGGEGSGVGGPFGLGGCPSQRRVFQVGNVLSDPQLIYVRDGLGGCISRSPDNFVYDFYTAGTEVPATDFVEGLPRRIGDGRIQLEATDGVDGSRQCRDAFNVFFDSSLETACRPSLDVNDVTRCMPANTYFSGMYFTDAACMGQQPAATRAACQPESPYVSEAAVSACGVSTRRVRQVGAALDDLFYRDPQDPTMSCQPLPATGYSIGEYVDDSMFASAILEWVPAGTRLERQDFVIDGARYPTGIWRDTMLQTECRFDAYQAAGMSRCTPWATREQPVANAWAYLVYTAADCAASSLQSYGIVDRSSTSLCAPPQLPPRFVQAHDANRNYVFHRVGNVVTGTFYYKLSDASPCEPLPATSTVYEIGEEVTNELVSGAEVQL